MFMLCPECVDMKSSFTTMLKRKIHPHYFAALHFIMFLEPFHGSKENIFLNALEWE